MTVSVVQHTDANGLFGTGLTAGNDVLFCGFGYDTSGTAITSGSPAVGGVPASGTLLQEQNAPLGGNVVYEGWWLLRNVAGGGTALSIVFTASGGASQASIIGIEVSGLPAALGTTVTSSGHGNSGGPADSGPTGAVTPLIAAGSSVGFGLVNTPPGAPWASAAGNSSYDCIGWQAQPGTGSYDWSAALGSSGPWAAGIVAIVASGPPPASAGLLMAAGIV